MIKHIITFKNNEDFLEDYGFFLIEEGDRATVERNIYEVTSDQPNE